MAVFPLSTLTNLILCSARKQIIKRVGYRMRYDMNLDLWRCLASFHDGAVSASMRRGSPPDIRSSVSAWISWSPPGPEYSCEPLSRITALYPFAASSASTYLSGVNGG